MNKSCFSILLLFSPFLFSALLSAQQQTAPPLYPAPGNTADIQSQQNQSQQNDQNTNQNAPMPVFRVNVYARSASAVNYRNRGGSTTVDFRGTNLMPEITGRAKVDGKVGRLAIDVELEHMQPPIKFGGQYLT